MCNAFNISSGSKLVFGHVACQAYVRPEVLR